MDRSALDYAYTIQGAHAMRAEALRREASELSRKATALLAEADMEDERAAWAGQMAEALDAETPAITTNHQNGEDR